MPVEPPDLSSLSSPDEYERLQAQKFLIEHVRDNHVALLAEVQAMIDAHLAASSD